MFIKFILKNNLFLLFLLFPFLLFAQTDYFSPTQVLNFAEHLYQQKDYYRAVGEFFRYQYLVSTFSDSIDFRIADCFFKTKQYEKSILYLSDKFANNQNTFSDQKSNYLILKNRFYLNQFKQILSEPIPPNNNAFFLDTILLHTYCHINLLEWEQAERLLEQQKDTNKFNDEYYNKLLIYCRKGNNLKLKSPFLAGTLSAMIPGLGKIYTNRTRDALYSFLSTSVFSYLAYDNYQKNGTESIRFNIYAGLSLVFYASNIFGTIISAKHYNHITINNHLHRLEIMLQ